MKNFGEFRKMANDYLPEKLFSPKPFPGPYPTRWVVGLNHRIPRTDRDETFSYFGRPCKQVVQHIQPFFAYDAYLIWTEFDQNGVIQKIDCALPLMDRYPVARYWQPEGIQYYYPFSQGLTLAEIWLREVVSTRMIVKPRAYTCYMPFAHKEGVQTAYNLVKGHEEWLQKANIQYK